MLVSPTLFHAIAHCACRDRNTLAILLLTEWVQGTPDQDVPASLSNALLTDLCCQDFSYNLGPFQIQSWRDYPWPLGWNSLLIPNTLYHYHLIFWSLKPFKHLAWPEIIGLIYLHPFFLCGPYLYTSLLNVSPAKGESLTFLFIDVYPELLEGH